MHAFPLHSVAVLVRSVGLRGLYRAAAAAAVATEALHAVGCTYTHWDGYAVAFAFALLSRVCFRINLDTCHGCKCGIRNNTTQWQP
jgi:hypothetical protein